MSKKRIRALLQYRHVLEPIKDNGLTFKWKNTPVPHYVLPATAAAYEQMVDQMDAAITSAINKWLAGGGPKACQDAPRACLRSIGITPPKKGRA